MPTQKQDKEFAEEMESSLDKVVMSSSSLDSAIEWIAARLDPDEVFDTKKLEQWAESNGYKKE